MVDERLIRKISLTNPGTVIIDLAGCERLMGTGRTIALLILGEVTKRGFESNVSIVSNPYTPKAFELCNLGRGTNLKCCLIEEAL